eukprot:scaffold549019_cov51-Prasinocladus_malaysianus.AAC.1
MFASPAGKPCYASATYVLKLAAGGLEPNTLQALRSKDSASWGYKQNFYFCNAWCAQTNAHLMFNCNPECCESKRTALAGGQVSMVQCKRVLVTDLSLKPPFGHQQHQGIDSASCLPRNK